MQFSKKEDEFYQWAKDRFNMKLADAGIFAQFLSDIKADTRSNTKQIDTAANLCEANEFGNAGLANPANILKNCMLDTGVHLRGNVNQEAQGKLHIDDEYLDIYYDGRFIFMLSITNDIPDNLQRELSKAVFELVKCACI